MGLTQLRTNPQTVLSSEHFFVDTRNLVQTPLGCTVQINEQLKNGVFYWDIANHHSTDFYFPYVQGNAGYVGIQTPIQDGTVVVTGGMNGCALEVCYLNDNYYFYHDAYGSNMHKQRNVGTQVCRIEAGNYWNNNIAGQSTFYIPTIQFVCVYKAGFWHVGASGIYYTGNDFASKEIKGVFVPEGGKYRGYFNDTIHLIQR